MSAADTPIGSLWVGTELRWLDLLALRSFAHHGHPVTLFHTHDLPDPQIEGVTLRHASEVYHYSDELMRRVTPTVFADLFRLHMVQDTDLTWVDTDCLCHRPLTPKDGYLVGYESPTTVNNAVLRLPKDSAALALLLDRLNDPGFVPPWLKRAHRKKLVALPAGEQLLGAAQLVPPVFGPQALTWALTETGEIEHVLPRHVLNPVHWSMADIYFNPYGGVEGWLRDDTQCIHLYASRIRAAHRRNIPYAGSFIANIAALVKHDFGGKPFRQT
tara:strand:+ start:356 stop:1171 length:816 start_codon:yes stop_codon:yes gene_type:complete